MSTPRFASLDLDEVEVSIRPDAILLGHYVGLLTKLPSVEDPHGVELASKHGYQRQYYEAKSPQQKLEWTATATWKTVRGFAVYNQFQGGEMFLWVAFFAELDIYNGETAVVHYPDLVKSVTDALTGKRNMTQASRTKEPTFK